MNGRNGGNAKEFGARLNMIGSMTGKSRPDFKAVALLSTVHRSFGRSAFLVPESSLMELGTSEPRNLRSRFMQRSSKGSSQENLKRNRRMNTCFLKASASSFHPMLIFAPDGLASRNGKTYRADCHCGDQASMALKPGF